MTTTTKQQELPVELIDLILEQVEPNNLQSTTLILLKSIPNSQLSISNLWKHCKITRLGQSFQAIQAKLLIKELANNACKSLKLLVWIDDPIQIINLAIPFNNLLILTLFVGPLFSPDILEELLLNPKFKQSIQSLTFRFNPYSEQRSYYTFLKVSYTFAFSTIYQNLNTHLRSGFQKYTIIFREFISIQLP
jgi:hypothetical protein